jgi:hypothetical protein
MGPGDKPVGKKTSPPAPFSSSRPERLPLNSPFVFFAGPLPRLGEEHPVSRPVVDLTDADATEGPFFVYDEERPTRVTLFLLDGVFLCRASRGEV